MAKANKSVTGTTLVTSVDGTTNGNRVCWTGTNEVAVANTYASCAAANYQPVYELTALAVTPGGSRRMTQYEITRGPFPTFPGALIFDSPGSPTPPDFGTNPHSNHLHASGIDAAQGPAAGVGCAAGVNQPAIGTPDAPGATHISGQLNDPSQFTGTAGVAPVGTTLSSDSGMNLETVDGLTKLVNMITTAAGSNVYNASTVSGINLGTDAAPVINVVNGDLTIGNGAGILLVTGTLTEAGGSSFDGLVLVIGKGSITKDGGGGGQYNGSTFLANMYTDTTYAHLIALGSNLPPGPTTMTWNGGGNALVQYDSCWVNSVTQSLPYTIVTQRELIY